MHTYTHPWTHTHKCTTKEIRGTSDIRISLSVSRHPFPSNALEMRVVMVTGAEKSPHGPPHPPWYTHTHTPFFSFSCPGIADVTGETMNLTYRSGDAYLGCGKPPGDVERKKPCCLTDRHTVQMPLKFKRETNKTKKKKFKIQSQRDLVLRVFSFCSHFSIFRRN